jgi:50S ribosome-binding GTPase
VADALTDSIAGLLRDARARTRSAEAGERLAGIGGRLHGPLRVAIAGRVKAGKSTLMNSLLGEELAATDAGECTQIVTWYVHGDRQQVTASPRSGPAEPRPFHRNGGPVQVDLGGRAPADVDHLTVTWPNSRLRQLVLIDTPGIASISTDVSQRTYTALAPDDERPAVADAVLYLLRHTHGSDMHFLEAFHSDELAQGTPMNAVGVLSRADEIGACRIDALDVAGRVAARYADDARLRRVCPVVVPVAGLLAFAGGTLSQAEFAALRKLAAADPGESEPLLLTADRLAHRPSPLPVTPIEREHLLSRFGLFGVRLSVQLLREGGVDDATALSEELRRLSGLDRLRQVLLRQFTERSQILKARSAILAVQALFDSGALDGSGGLQARFEALVGGAHAFAEVRLLAALRSGELKLPANRAGDLERVLGGFGHDAATRLGVPAESPPDTIRQAAESALASWLRLAEHPLTGRPVELAARAAVRTLEGLLSEIRERS